MSYIELGYNRLLNRNIPIESMNDSSSSRYITSLSGSNVSGGITTSNTGTLSINWDTGEIIINDGVRSRVLMGYVAEEDAYGIKILDHLGNIVLSAAGKLGSGALEDGSVGSDALAYDSVDTFNIKDYAVTDVKISSLSANKILAGDLVVAVDVGNPSTGYVRLDGENNRIVVHDGINPRIVIGEI